MSGWMRIADLLKIGRPRKPYQPADDDHRLTELPDFSKPIPLPKPRTFIEYEQQRRERILWLGDLCSTCGGSGIVSVERDFGPNGYGGRKTLRDWTPCPDCRKDAKPATRVVNVINPAEVLREIAIQEAHAAGREVDHESFDRAAAALDEPVLPLPEAESKPCMICSGSGRVPK